MRNTFERAAALALVASGLVVAMGLRASAQELSEAVRVIATRWLATDCGLGGSVEDELRRAASPALEAFFFRALDKGPDSVQMTELEQAAARRYEQRQEALKRPEGLGLSREQLAQAQTISRDSFIAQEKQDFLVRYQSQAVAGLGIIGGPKARARLQSLARDEKSPLKGSAQQALARMRERK